VNDKQLEKFSHAEDSCKRK